MVKDWIPISHDNYKQVQGPFYHGTKANLAIGDLLTTGFISHFEDGRILKHIYFSALMELNLLCHCLASRVAATYT